jgi:hypothetical protein
LRIERVVVEMTRQHRIDELISQETDRQRLKRLNWLWWREFFKAMKRPELRKAA